MKYKQVQKSNVGNKVTERKLGITVPCNSNFSFFGTIADLKHKEMDFECINHKNNPHIEG
jgi:hypothetical protein